MPKQLESLEKELKAASARGERLTTHLKGISFGSDRTSIVLTRLGTLELRGIRSQSTAQVLAKLTALFRARRSSATT